ncbi:helix-turn-helix domain-containing protein [Streptomyces sp. MBT49]|nr:helix-turn-helix domain-containing protein [Streptomyces sp. MBT49]
MLRALKERAGLSYGALAGRLHLSTSTVHRYCTGDSVPAEFAPVERFGRICRADPEELLELHRRWAVADQVPPADDCPPRDATRTTRPTTFRLKVRSTAEDPVTMTAMDVRVLSAEAPPAGVTYADCQGADAQHSFAVDLDAPEPRAVSPRRGFPYQASAGTPLVLDVTTHTLKNEVRWYLELRWTQGPRSGTLRIDDGGHPFRTGAVK